MAKLKVAITANDVHLGFKKYHAHDLLGNDPDQHWPDQHWPNRHWPDRH